MAYDSYTLLHVRQDGALVTAVIDAPPINVINVARRPSGDPSFRDTNICKCSRI